MKNFHHFSLEQKEYFSILRIEDWFEFNDGNVYISFSGGKDSTVLLHLVRRVYPNIKAVFCNTRTEHPSIRSHVKTFDNVEIIYPEMNFAQAVKECGWCVPDKSVANYVERYHKGQLGAKFKFEGLNADGTISPYYTQRYKRNSCYLEAPFKISQRCCDELKKKPLAKWEKENGSPVPFLGILASESVERRNLWFKNGCNAYEAKHPQSIPLAIWTEQDILQYHLQYNLSLATCYGEIVENKSGNLTTTGMTRTGCLCCPIGAKNFSKNRLSKFEILAKDNPRYHNGLMKSSLGLRDVLLFMKAPLGCVDCGGRCACGKDPFAPKWKTK